MFLSLQLDSESNLPSDDAISGHQPQVKQEQGLEVDHDCNENLTNTMTKNNNSPISKSPRRPQDPNSFTLLSYGMTSGLEGEGDGASIGEIELSIWLEHVWLKHFPQSNFLLADSYAVHTAQKTQRLLLEGSCVDRRKSVTKPMIFTHLRLCGLHRANCLYFT